MPIQIVDKEEKAGRQKDLSEHLSQVESLKDLLRLVRRHLHTHPEIGLEEIETHRFLKQVLQSYDLEVHGPLAGTGLYVEIEGARPGPTIGYRADIDALPIHDAKRVPYASTNPGVGHLCGHDAHTAIAVGVALLLTKRKDELNGRVRIFFQPNEEGHPSGASLMIRDGILESLQAAFAVHVDPTLPLGTFGLRAGPLTAAADAFTINVKGPTTSHAARPHQTVDVIWVMTQIMNALYQIAGRLHDARNTAVLTFTKTKAGHAFNIVPAEASVSGTLRCIDRSERIHLKDRIQEISEQIGAIYSADVSVDFMTGSPPVVNDKRLIKTVQDSITELFSEKSIIWINRPSMGAEDFAHYLEHIPGAMIRIGTCDGPNSSHPLHDSKFDIAEDAMPLSAEVMAESIVRQLAKMPANGTR